MFFYFFIEFNTHFSFKVFQLDKHFSTSFLIESLESNSLLCVCRLVIRSSRDFNDFNFTYKQVI